MTAICVHKDSGGTIIGADSRAGYGPSTYVVQKIFRISDSVVATVAGSVVWCTWWQHHAPNLFSPTLPLDVALHGLVEAGVAHYRSLGHDPVNASCSVLLASYDRAWYGSTSGELREIVESEGAGDATAIESCLLLAKKLGVQDPAERVRLALESVTARNVFCGPPIRIWRVTIEGIQVIADTTQDGPT